MNTAETIAGQVCATTAFLGIAIGYPWLWLHYAGKGVLKLSRPTERKSAPRGDTDAAAGAGDGAGEAPSEAVAPAAVPLSAERRAS